MIEARRIKAMTKYITAGSSYYLELREQREEVAVIENLRSSEEVSMDLEFRPLKASVAGCCRKQ